MKTLITLLILICSPINLYAAVAAHDLVQQGNEAFTQGDWQSAYDFYQQALEDTPDKTIILYNLGNVLFRQEKYHAALKMFNRQLRARASRFLPVPYSLMLVIPLCSLPNCKPQKNTILAH
jgi:tetratricopeptide (TPR) repeat protein